MRVLHVHAHFDDFEFVAAGTFELWRRQLGAEFQGKVVVCTDGRSGHQFRTREETARVRLAEQTASAQLGGYEFELLRKSDGLPFEEACRVLTTDLLAALWKTIREFEPDYLLCPPLPLDNLAGVHPDHITVAEAVRRVAYMINVPHAFLGEYPVADETKSRWVKTPVILNTYDGYMAGANACDLVVNVEEAFDMVAAESWCHQSQINEWLPWVARHHIEPTADLAAWKGKLRGRFDRQARELGLPVGRAHEAFTVTAWGSVPSAEELARVFPNLIEDGERTARLRARLARWSGT
ncbi:MAG TPA: PIG-L family deacetylase [Candidatus Limnocylindria bacterium]|jgi:LmbE family N-acetylglucosaminyl deacetylase|nr:PIG-L family deacetylase [Candidatus Limnocylindria bacterium]